jgi:type IV secretion system protein VirD4
MAEAERSGVVSTALGFLALYRDPVLAHATEVSDFDIEDLILGARPVSLYFIVPPEEISRLKALLRLILNQVLKRLTEIAGQQAGNGRRVLLMLDEFPQLGRLDFFEHALAYIRGYRIKACLVAQSLNQIAQAYGEHNSILDNAHVRVAFACNDERTAKRISDMLGVTTETRAQMNYAGSRMAPWLGHTMVSRQEVPRPLLTPGEVMQLPESDELVFVGGAPPIRAKKVRYFADPIFKERIKPAAAFTPPSGGGRPSVWDGLAAPSKAAPLQKKPQTPATKVGPHQRGFDFSQMPGAAQDLAPEAAIEPVAERAPTNTNQSDDLDVGLVSAGELARTQFGIDPDHPDLAGS